MAKKSKKVAPDEATKAIYNHSVMLKHDPYLAQIFLVSSICNVYRFDLDTSEWDKVDCQGPLFIYSRAAQEPVGNSLIYPYGLVVLNRLGLEDFSLGITPRELAQQANSPEVEVAMEGNFVMLQAADGEMYGLWIFDEADRQLVLSTLNYCINDAPIRVELNVSSAGQEQHEASQSSDGSRAELSASLAA